MNALRFLVSQFQPRRMDTNLDPPENSKGCSHQTSTAIAKYRYCFFIQSFIYIADAPLARASSTEILTDDTISDAFTDDNEFLRWSSTSGSSSQVNFTHSSVRTQDNRRISEGMTRTEPAAAYAGSQHSRKTSYASDSPSISSVKPTHTMKRKVLVDDVGAQLLALEKEKFNARKEKASAFGCCSEDEDNKLFFMSLLPLLRNFTPRQKVEYRSQILSFTNNLIFYRLMK